LNGAKSAQRTHIGAMLIVPLLGAPVVTDDCHSLDFMAFELPQTAPDDPIAVALSLACIKLRIIDDQLVMPNGARLPLGADTNRGAKERMRDATDRKHFHDIYPLSFDLTSRSEL
jgi:hypothetical protein